MLTRGSQRARQLEHLHDLRGSGAEGPRTRVRAAAPALLRCVAAAARARAARSPCCSRSSRGRDTPQQRRRRATHARARAFGATPDEVTEVLELTGTLGDPRVQLRRADPARGAGRGRAGSVDFTEPLERSAGGDQGGARPTSAATGTRSGTGAAARRRTSSRPTRRLSSHPWEHGSLEPKVRELIYTAFDASATHMFEPGCGSTSATRSPWARRGRS